MGSDIAGVKLPQGTFLRLTLVPTLIHSSEKQGKTVLLLAHCTERSHTETLSSSYFLQRSAGSWSSRNMYKELRRTECGVISGLKKIIPRSYMEGIPTLHNQPINEANPSLNMWHLIDCRVEIWCEHSISFLFVFFLTLSRAIHPQLIQQNWEMPTQRGCKQSMKIYDVSSQLASSSFSSFMDSVA